MHIADTLKVPKITCSHADSVEKRSDEGDVIIGNGAFVEFCLTQPVDPYASHGALRPKRDSMGGGSDGDGNGGDIKSGARSGELGNLEEGEAAHQILHDHWSDNHSDHRQKDGIEDSFEQIETLEKSGRGASNLLARW